jgi:16S rRNA (adenine1518-N6/adenine1519-N6)-dimethyltransferase
MTTLDQSMKPPNVRKLLRHFNIRPDKKLGQNFLIDQGSLQKIIKIANLQGDEVVVEIGAGLGSLTYHLSDAAENVIAIEFDERLIPALETVLLPLKNVEMVIGDILQIPIESLVGYRPYQIIANIPYNITSKLIRQLLENPNPPTRLILTLQKEVAQRIVALPGDLSLLALSVLVYGNPRTMGSIPSEAFYPQPKVDSSILMIDLYETAVVPHTLISTFFQLARIGFNQRRKQLKNSIAGGLGIPKEQAYDWLKEARIDPKQRPQELEVHDWVGLAEVVQRMQEPPV